MCLEALGEGFPWGRLEGGQQKTMVSTKALPEDLNLKFRLKLNHGCFHCAILKGLHGVKEKRYY